MLYEYLKKGFTKFVISSSGNSGMVAAHCAMKTNANFDLVVYLSEYISNLKLGEFLNTLGIAEVQNELRAKKKFVKNNVTLILTENPKQQAFMKVTENFVNLRGSTDALAPVGFRTIADELIPQLGNSIDAVFIPASSGTTALGVYEGFKFHGLNPQIHVVQTTKVNSLVKGIAETAEVEIEHPSEAIVDLVGHRKDEIQEIIRSSRGKGWVINSSEVEYAKLHLSKTGIEVSYDSALGVAAFAKAVKEQKFRNPVILCTG